MKKLLFVLLLTISSIVHAQWTFIGHSSDNDEFFIDYSTVQRVNKIVKVWIKVNFSEITQGVYSTRNYQEYDCSEKKYRNLTITGFKKPNLEQLYRSDNQPTEYTFIPPGTLSLVIFNIVCKTK
jgi:hypothetical protein